MISAININTELLIPNIEFNIIAIPPTPPGTKLLGTKKRLYDIDNIKHPIINSIYLFTFDFLFICFRQ